MMYKEDYLHGATLMVFSALMFAIMGVCIKSAASELDNTMIVFLRNLFGLLFLLPWLLKGGLLTLQSDRKGMHLMRSLTGLAAMYCFFYAIAHMDLSGAVLLNFSAPLFVPLIGLIWLREHVPMLVLWALLIGFIGVAFILRPDTSSFNPVALIGLASGILAAVAMVCIRAMSTTEPTTRIVFYYSLICTLVSAIPLTWAWHTPTLNSLSFMIAAGVLATSGQLLMTRAYAHAPAARIGPFIYTAVVFAGLFSWLLWKESPDIMSFVGMLLVGLAGILAIRKQP